MTEILWKELRGFICFHENNFGVEEVQDIKKETVQQ